MTALKKKLKPRTHYVWIRWVIFWGIGAGIFYFLVNYLFFKEGFSLRGKIFTFILFPIVGYIVGALSWKVAQNKKKYLFDQLNGNA